MDWATLLISAIVGGLIGAIVGFPFGIFGNIVTSPIQDYLKNRSLSSRERKIKRIISDYRLAQICFKNQTQLIVLLLHRILIVLTQITVLLMAMAIFIIFPADFDVFRFVQVLLIGYTIASIFKIGMSASSLVVNSGDLSSYNLKIIAKLKKLGVNLEDLDKEEAVG